MITQSDGRVGVVNKYLTESNERFVEWSDKVESQGQSLQESVVCVCAYMRVCCVTIEITYGEKI